MLHIHRNKKATLKQSTTSKNQKPFREEHFTTLVLNKEVMWSFKEITMKSCVKEIKYICSRLVIFGFETVSDAEFSAQHMSAMIVALNQRTDYLEKYLIIVKYLTAAAQILFDRSIITWFLPLSDVCHEWQGI